MPSSILNILSMHFAQEEMERVREESSRQQPEHIPDDPEQEIWLWAIYRPANRVTRRNHGLIYVQTRDLTVAQARILTAQGSVLKFYPKFKQPDRRPEGFLSFSEWPEEGG